MKNIHYRKCFTLIALFIGVISNSYAAVTIEIENGYVKASIPGSAITAAYMEINNTGNEAVTLQKVTGSISPQIEIHEHSMTNGMMRMRQVDNIVIKANSRIVLQPSGLHLMIFSLTQQLTEKEVVSLTLYFSNDTKMNIQLPVIQFK